MFAFLGVCLQAVSAHKLISEGRETLLHTVLSRGMCAFLRGERRVGELTRRSCGLVPVPASATRLPAAVLGPAGVLLLLSIPPALSLAQPQSSFYHPSRWHWKVQQLLQGGEGRETWEGQSREDGGMVGS